MDFPLLILLFEDHIIYVIWLSEQLNMATFGVKMAYAEIIWSKIESTQQPSVIVYDPTSIAEILLI